MGFRGKTLSRLFLAGIIFVFSIVIIVSYNFSMIKRQFFFMRSECYPLYKSTQASQSLNFNKLGHSNVLSYSLFGKNSLKTYGESVAGMLKEASRSNFYIDWQIWLFTDQDVNESQLKTWQSLNSKFVIKDVRKYSEIPDVQFKNGMVWRFLPMSDPSIDVACSRDLDSPLLKREEAAVQEFLQSNFIFHGMRDAPVHGSEILGGMWCFRNIKNRELGKCLLHSVVKHAQSRIPNKKEADKGNDQHIINRFLWPFVKFDSMNHCSFLCDWQPPENTRPFPTKRVGSEFVGCIKPDCNYTLERLKCPKKCRPKNHPDWIYC